MVRSQVTQDPEYTVGIQQRLVKDQTPDYDSATQRLRRVLPVPAGQDHIEYVVTPIVYTDEEFINHAVHKRREDLTNSDWTQLPDADLTETQLQAWRLYRQQLRDITKQPGYPRNIDWPIEPE